MANKNFVVHNGLTVGSLTVDAATGDVTTSGNLTVTGNVAVSAIQNGNSNVRVAANGNVAISAIGTANVMTITATGANISGTANVTGNANVGNLGTGTVIATTANLTTINSGLIQNGTSNVTIASGGSVSTFISGNATAQLIVTSTGANIAGTANIATANVTTINSGLLQNGTSNITVNSNGNVNISVSGNVLTITSTGANVTGTLGVSGNANVGNLGTAGAITATGNITAGNLVATGDIQVNGNDIRSSTGNVAITLNNQDVTIVGNLAVQGTTSTIGSENYSVLDSIIDLHTFPNLAPLTADDGRDIGIRMHYFKSVDDKHAFVGWANDTSFLEYYSDATESAGVISGTYGTIKAANFFANSGVFYNGNSNVTVSAGGNVSVFVAGNATARAVFTSTGANIAGTANVTGNANVGNLGTATAIITTGNITTINSGLMQNGNSNVAIAANGNVTISATGVANIITAANTGVSIGGNITLTGNIVDSGALDISTGANGNLSLSPNGTGIVVSSKNINAPAFVNGNSGVTVTANANVTINVTAANSYTFATGSFAPSANATVQLGLTGARWSNIWGLASSAQYADLAERYDAGIFIEPGTVVEFGGDNEVQICGTQMSTKVAGVVSTAPGYLMNDTEDKGDNWVPVALQGRVPTKVVGPVAKGDMMVSAGNGHAMSCAAPVVGSVIGKALENFEGAEGVIEVVVGRL